jgi:hypothetical protein
VTTPQLADDPSQLTVDECVQALTCIADTSRRTTDVESLRSGFIDGISGRSSQADPGADPKSYAAGYAFGSELVDVLCWTHEIQQDAAKSR